MTLVKIGCTQRATDFPYSLNMKNNLKKEKRKIISILRNVPDFIVIFLNKLEVSAVGNHGIHPAILLILIVKKKMH